MGGYFAKVSQLAVITAVGKYFGISGWWALGICVLSGVAIFVIDKKWVYPEESREALQHNPEWNDLKNKGIK